MKPAWFLLAAALTASAQTSTAHPSTFEAAVIKPSPPTAIGSHIRNEPGRFVTSNTTLAQLIAYALPTQDFQILSGPAWLRTARFDINATTGHSDSDVKNQAERIARIRARLRNFLEDRFQLQLTQEQREMPVYALTVDKAGPRMKPADPLGNVNLNDGAAGSTLEGKGMTMPRLAEILSNVAQRPVNDETSLPGAFDLELKYTLELDTPDASSPPKDLSGTYPSLFTALKEQLGLRLSPKKAPAPVWVILRAEKPGEN